MIKKIYAMLVKLDDLCFGPKDMGTAEDEKWYHFVVGAILIFSTVFVMGWLFIECYIPWKMLN